MRILVACDWFLKNAAGQAQALTRAGAEVRLLCRSHALEFGGSAAERDELLRSLEGVGVYELGGRVSSISAAAQVLRLRRAIRRWHPDLVHAHDNGDPRLLAIVAGLPRVTSIHDPVPHPGQPVPNVLERFVRRRWIRSSAVAIVHGESLVAELPEWARARRTAALPLGADVRTAPLPVPEEPRILLFGRLEPYKGIDVLMRALRRIWDVRPEVTLQIAGTGGESDAIASDPRIHRRIGYIPETELTELFARARLAVLPYTQASQSGVGTLTIGHGLPTVVSDVGSLRDLALDASFLVPAGDDAILAEAILRHIDHGPELRKDVLAFARDRISWEAAARQSLELYESVLAGARA